jgi:hypothetical protein
MEEEDQAVFSEVKIEMDVAEPAYWTTQQWTQEQGQGKSAALSAGFVLITFCLKNNRKIHVNFAKHTLKTKYVAGSYQLPSLPIFVKRDQ